MPPPNGRERKKTEQNAVGFFSPAYPSLERKRLSENAVVGVFVREKKKNTTESDGHGGEGRGGGFEGFGGGY